jgi:ATP-dependent DNA ligase
MTVRLTMNYIEVEASQIDAAIADDRVAVEQKVDGTRSLVVLERFEDGSTMTRYLGRNGGLLKHTAAMQHFSSITPALWTVFGEHPGEVVIDGEIMIDTGEFVAFDLPFMQISGREFSTPSHLYWQRLQLLRTLFHNAPAPLRLVRSEVSANGKQALWEDIQRSGGEGVMVKDLESTYDAGVRAKHSRKIKFVKTADVIVTGSTRGRNDAGRETGSFSFAVKCKTCLGTGLTMVSRCNECSGIGLLALGACSAIGKPEVKAGDVIEVAYLYRGEGGNLVQPRMMRVREDKIPNDCTLDQFPTYSKAVL